MSELYWLGVLDNLDSCDQFVVFFSYYSIVLFRYHDNYVQF